MKVKFGYICLLILFYSCSSSPSVIIDGYQDKISYNPSENIAVYLNSKKTGLKSISLFNINGEEVDKVTTHLFSQNISDTAYWWRNGFKYKKTFDYDANKLKSGIYYFENSSPFVLKNSTKKNEVLVVYPSNTDNAYNKRGGRSSYTKPLGTQLSFLRPFNIHKYAKEFLKWLPKQHFKVDYICDSDLESYENIENYKVLIITGHNEYWTRKARSNFDKFVNKGGNTVILSGNTMWWQVRYDRANMICYKNYENDPLVVDSLKTISWEDTILNYSILSSIGADFNNGGYGLKKDKGWDGYKITNNSPLFKNTGIKVGDIIKVPTAEYDGVPLAFNNDIPEIDTNKVKFYRQKLLGYDKGFRVYQTYGTFIVFQKTKTSGIIINTGSTNWCSDGFLSDDGEKIKVLTYNCIGFLLKGKEVFRK